MKDRSRFLLIMLFVFLNDVCYSVIKILDAMCERTDPKHEFYGNERNDDDECCDIDGIFQVEKKIKPKPTLLVKHHDETGMYQ